MKILNIYNIFSNSSIPHELECYMADKFKSDSFLNLRLNTFEDFLRNFSKLIRVIGDSDVVHSHHTFSSIIVSLYKILFIGRGKLFFCTVHRDYRTASKMTALIFFLLVFPFRDKIICNSNATMSSLPWYVKRFFPNKIKVVYNGINLSNISCSINFPLKKLHLIAVGRLVADKDQITLIKMCSVLTKRKIDYHLTICGGGPLEGLLRQEIIKRGLSGSVSLLGNLSRSDVYKNLFNSCVYLSTSITEGFGNSNIEAMASGCPVVISDIPVHTEIMDCQKLKFPVGDYVELSNKITKLVNDETYFRNVAVNGVKKSKEYSLEFTANAYHSLYLESKL